MRGRVAATERLRVRVRASKTKSRRRARIYRLPVGAIAAAVGALRATMIPAADARRPALWTPKRG